MALTLATAYWMVLNRSQAILSEALGAAIIPPLGAAVSLPNTFLDSVVTAALYDCQKTVVDPINPTDADCSAVDGADLPKFWDCAEYRALEAALNQYLQVSQSLGQVSISQSDLGNRLQRLVEFKAGQIKERYGVGVFNPGHGTIAVGQIPPYVPRPHVPPGQNWPPYGRGRGFFGGRF